MRFVAGLILIALSLSAQTWNTKTDLPDVTWGAATPVQKQRGLKVLRALDCTCGCNLKLAQCRVEDPSCSQSKMLANLVAKTAAGDRSESEMTRLVANTDLAKRATMRNRVLWDAVEIPTKGVPSKGPENARVTIVEYSDFQCPYCTTAVGNLNALMKMYPNDVRLVFKQFPLDNHSNARLAAAASLAAHEQGKFWPLHDKFYQNTRGLSRGNIMLWAKEQGLDMTKFTADLDSARIKELVSKELAEGEKFGVEGTPTIYINGKKYNAGIDPQNLKPIIDEELKSRRLF